MVEEHSPCQLSMTMWTCVPEYCHGRRALPLSASMTMWTCVPEYCHGRRALPLSAFHDDVDVCAGVLSW